MESWFRIGALARQAQCQTETIRFYEREGLLPAPTRSAGNYRFTGVRTRSGSPLSVIVVPWT